MNKPLLVFQAPIATRSGYGDHARDLLKSLKDMDKFDIKIVSTKWGNTPMDQINPQTEFGRWIINNVITSLDRQPDVYIQVTVANEFNPIGKYNIGITAGVETTIAPKEFIDGCNKMDLILVPSTFTKNVLETTQYSQIDKRTGQKHGDIKINRPIEVLFEGVDTTIFNKLSTPEPLEFLDSVEEDFNFLFVGHWLQGDLGEDRKDVGMMIKTFCTVFNTLPKTKRPGLILKTSSAGFSVMGREEIAKKILNIQKEFGDDCPSIYLLYGDMTSDELNRLYNHQKVKAMISFTKGEGYGRPLAEFAMTGKPILVSNWSGHMDFLLETMSVHLEGDLKNVHPSASNNFLLKESKWFTVDYSNAADKLYKVFNHYDKFLNYSKKSTHHITENFSLDKMTDEFKKLVDRYVKVAQKIELKLPTLTKL